MAASAWARVSATFSRPSVRFAVLWAVLPNALFVPLSFFAAPIRTPAILIFFVVGLVTANFPAGIAAIVLAAAVAFDVLWFISSAYGLSISMLVESLSFAWRVHFYASPIFVAAGAGLLIQAGLILWLRSRWAQDLKSARPYLGLALVMLFAVVDASVNLPPTQSITGKAFAHGEPLSATRSSGFATRVVEGRGDALFVLVEAYGALSSTAERDRVEAAFADPRLRARYDIQVGEVPYHGSTTAAEMRELCGTRVEYSALFKDADPDCLPERLAGHGYETIGLHAFTGSFFNRDGWWPKIGLQESEFAEQLLAMKGRNWHECGPVFTGLCDVEVAGRLRELLGEPHDKPRFVYWLTLNTHIPVVPDSKDSEFGCGTPADPFEDGQTCALADIWSKTFRSLVDVLIKDEVRPKNVLIVGDHAPPSWTRRGRSLFEPGVVRWISLTAKPDRLAEVGRVEPASGE